MQRVEARHLLLVGGDDDLAAALVADAVSVAELRHEPRALHAEARLVGTGLVVDARVDHPGIVSGLMRGDPGLLVEHDHARARMPLGEAHRGRQSEDAGSDDGHVRGLEHAQHNSTPLRGRVPSVP
jgi:hypothetical protein